MVPHQQQSKAVDWLGQTLSSSWSNTWSSWRWLGQHRSSSALPRLFGISAHSPSIDAAAGFSLSLQAAAAPLSTAGQPVHGAPLLTCALHALSMCSAHSHLRALPPNPSPSTYPAVPDNCPSPLCRKGLAAAVWRPAVGAFEVIERGRQAFNGQGEQQTHSLCGFQAAVCLHARAKGSCSSNWRAWRCKQAGQRSSQAATQHPCTTHSAPACLRGCLPACLPACPSRLPACPFCLSPAGFTHNKKLYLNIEEAV